MNKFENYYELADKIFSSFVDKLGMDGKYYINSFGKIPYVLNNYDVNQFVSPNDMDYIDDLCEDKSLSDSDKSLAKNIGMIVFSKDYFNHESEKEQLITIMHEKLHARRNLLIRDLDNDEGYNLNNGVVEPMSMRYNVHYADPGQEILHGNVDSSRTKVNKYLKMSASEKEDIKFANEEEGAKRGYDQEVDESLVELMTYCAYYLYINQNKTIKDFLTIYSNIDDEKISSLCKIMLSHNDLELFKWMISPIEYTMGDIHYDFFKNYTKDDSSELKEPFKDISGVDDDLIDEICR